MDNSSGELNRRAGKHYVVSDLHGMYGTYLDVIHSITDEDTLYILGDVIDVGQHGIKILQDIMKRPNVRLLLGDHEWRFMKCFRIMREHDLSVREMSIYTRKSELTRKKEEGIMSAQSAKDGMEEVAKQLKSNGFIEKEDISPSDLAEIGAWIKAGGMPTLRAFDALPKEEQDKIMDYLSNAIIIGFLNIDGKKECLVHSAPYDQKVFLTHLGRVKYEEFIRYNEIIGLNSKIVSQFIEGCTERGQDQFRPRRTSSFAEMHKIGFETLYGHTPQAGQATKCVRDGSICLDISDSGAALYCVEDGLVRYIRRAMDEPSGEISEPREPKIIEDRLTEFIKEKEIKGEIADIRTYTTPVLDIQSDSSNPANNNPIDPADSGDR